MLQVVEFSGGDLALVDAILYYSSRIICEQKHMFWQLICKFVMDASLWSKHSSQAIGPVI